MALDASRWGSAVAAAIAGVGVSAGTPITSGQLESIWQIICGQHKTEINDNAVVSTSVAVASVSGVTPGGGTSGPGTGTGTGNVL